ncbi:AraC family transcriptional regulator [Ruegeria sp.]|uniref:AraC family transcriptional regulator n=1 Tax=Ruegeria sp. TaxID=1879320 RepID=UPI003C7C01A4
MDVVSEMLSHIPVKGRTIGLLSLRGDWAFESPMNEEAVFHLISNGSVVITVKGEQVQLRKGDMILFTQGQTHVLSSAPGAPLVTFAEEDTRVRVHSVEDGDVHDVLKSGDGPETSIVCARFNLGSAAATHLSKSFPDQITLRKETNEKAELIEPLLRSIAHEANSNSPGALAALDGMLNILFIHFMRSWLESSPEAHDGWLKGLQDPSIARALKLMHDEPARDWTIQELAEATGMSRAKFAAQFTKLIGEPPLKYLTRWRMVLAAEQLGNVSGPAIIDVALSVGYQSEASFSASFKRQFGIPPGAWRKRQLASVSR